MVLFPGSEMSWRVGFPFKSLGNLGHGSECCSQQMKTCNSFSLVFYGLSSSQISFDFSTAKPDPPPPPFLSTGLSAGFEKKLFCFLVS